MGFSFPLLDSWSIITLLKNLRCFTYGACPGPCFSCGFLNLASDTFPVFVCIFFPSIPTPFFFHPFDSKIKNEISDYLLRTPATKDFVTLPSEQFHLSSLISIQRPIAFKSMHRHTNVLLSCDRSQFVSEHAHFFSVQFTLHRKRLPPQHPLCLQ